LATNQKKTAGSYFKNKRVLITSGPTWVAIDDVRVISNIASGETGVALTKRFLKSGAHVTLLLGPCDYSVTGRNLTVKRFRFFDELRLLVRSLLRRHSFDFIVHSAAVSDFKPSCRLKGKLASDVSAELKLKPLPKIIKDICRGRGRAKAVMFKLETSVTDDVLLTKAKEALQETGAQFIVANRVAPYRAFILDTKGVIRAESGSKSALADSLLDVLREGTI
jgi:phosphopantothenoylcysteine synthetase/decarboxylase